MNDNFKDDYLLLEGNQDSFNLKIKRQKKRVVFFLLCIWILITLYIINRDTIDKLLNNDITIISQDWTQRMSLKRNNSKYHWPNSCPKWYHIPSLYERERLFIIWCEDQKDCNTWDIKINYDLFSWMPKFQFSAYWSNNIEKVIKRFVKKFNINPNWKLQMDPFPHWAYKQISYWIKHYSKRWNIKYCDSLEFTVNTKYTKLSSEIEDEYIWECEEPEKVRCFSDLNLTSNFMNDEKIRWMYSIADTDFEIDWIRHSWLKITMYHWFEYNKDIIIPEEFEWKPIIEIWKKAFRWRWYNSVTFSKNLIKIWDEAFLDNNISNLNIPDNILYIWSNAFAGNDLTHIEVPDTVKYLKSWAFSRNSISSFKLQSRLKEIPSNLFYRNNLENLEISEWIEIIWDNAFRKANIKQLRLPSTLKEIWDWSFADNNLVNLEIPDWTEIIGKEAFKRSNIKILKLSSTVKEIWDQAFLCNDLAEISIPQSVKIIWRLAFCWNEKNRESNWNGPCTQNGYVVVKWYPKDSNTFININPFKSCNNEEEKRVCSWYTAFKNYCYMKAYWYEEDPDYEFIDWRCVLKKQ